MSCTGAPAGASCSLPATIMVNPATASTFNVSVTTTQRSFAFLHRFDEFAPPWIWVGGLMALIVVMKYNQKNLRVRRAWLLAPLSVIFLCSCGGGSANTSNSGTPAGNYVLTVTATSGVAIQNVSLNVSVQ